MSIGNLHMLLASTASDLLRIQSNAFSWGSNGNGRLGNNSTIDRSSPVFVSGGIKNWTSVSSHPIGSHVLAIRADGTAWAWGSGGSGRLGDNSTLNQSSPVSVVGGFTDWIQVSAGSTHSLGVRANGTAWAWGGGANGKLGDNSTVAQSSPVSVVGGFSDWTQVSAGTDHSLGVRGDGTAWAWGSGSQGVLGDNTTTQKSSPVSVVGGFTNWTQVSAGNSHSIGVRLDGTAWAWGSGGSGRLGDNSTVAQSSPVSVVGGFTNWTQVSAGLYHSMGVRSSGGAWAWGNGANGRLGNNSTTNRSSPVAVSGSFSDWIQVSAGITHSSGVRSSGTAWAWGFNGQGQLGNNSTVDRSSPVSVVGGIGDWVAVSSGSAFTTGIRQTF
jgi:alpha-tubulin suppressor-like RCC1 family protein